MNPAAVPCLAQAATSFRNLQDVDWSLNAGIFLALAVALVATYFASVRGFERAIDDAGAGKPVGVRDAYNRFWTAMLVAGAVAVGLGVFVSVYPVQSLFVSS